VRQTRQALALAPALADAHELLGRILSETGPAAAAIERLTTTLELDPGFTSATTMLARTYALSGDWARAEALLDGACKVSDNRTGMFQRARLLVWRRDREGARALLAACGDMPPAALALLKLAVSPEADVDSIKTWAPVGLSSHGTWRTQALACQARAEVALARGLDDEALETLARAVDLGLIDLLWLDGCPLFDTLRPLPRFVALRDRVVERAARVQRALA
jgi:serine/threonine-protein kinase